MWDLLEVMKEFASKKHARLSKLLISLNKEKSSRKDGRRRRAAGAGAGSGDGIVTVRGKLCLLILIIW